MLLSRAAALLFLAVLSACGARRPESDAEPIVPATLDEFRAAAEQIIRETGIPGAGLALVRPDRIEWAGGIGFAEREQQVPVTADTHFRVGSVSKTFVAIALVQQYLDDTLDIEAPLTEVAPEVRIENPYPRAPVTVVQLLQHTAGFDDMHFNEMYNLHDPPDMPLLEVLARSPASRRVRWRPGTRMSYSNPGYAVAGYVLEKVTGRRYEDVIRDRIFTPLGMRTSSFRLEDADLPLLARGYDSADGPPVPFAQIYLRPAGNLHTSARELGSFVQMLLNWGETAEELVIDPEYLSNMERPRTSRAARAGLIYGYGSGIASGSIAGYPTLGHGGGIDGFVSAYGYSAARDAGWVVLLNGTYAPAALQQLQELAVRYLKRDIEPPAKPELQVAPDLLDTHAGYYHQDGARNQVMTGLEWLLGGIEIHRNGNALVASPVFGAPAERLVPVSPNLFRREREVTPSRVFTTDEDGRKLLLADGYYGVRVSRWRVEPVRGAVLLSLLLIGTIPLAVLVWLIRSRRAAPHKFWALKLTLALLPAALLACLALALAPPREWGELNMWTRSTFLGTAAVPLLSVIALALLGDAWRRGAGRWFAGYATIVTLAALCLSAYLAAWGLVGLRPWAF